MQQSLNKSLLPATPLTIDTARALVRTHLEDYFSRRTTEADALHPRYGRLWQTMRELGMVGGKRLRPYLLLLAYEAYAPDGDMHAVVPAAAAQELLHLAMLIHDDIIDRDDVRYGIPNIAGQYQEIYKDVTDEAQRAHYAGAAAILAGDSLLSDAYEMLGGVRTAAGNGVAASRLLHEAIFKTIGGELLDTEAAFVHEARSDPLATARAKTAAYSFVAPLRIGAYFAGAPARQSVLLEAIGYSMGTIYQLRDDLLGVFGDAELTGKSTDGDIRQGKYTHLISLFYERANTVQAQRFEAISGNAAAGEADIRLVRQLLEETGARHALEEDIITQTAALRTSIAQLAVDDTYKTALRALAADNVSRVL